MEVKTIGAKNSHSCQTVIKTVQLKLYSKTAKDGPPK